MPDDFDNQDNPDPANLRAQLEQQSQARAQAEQELAQLRAESYFRSAGVDPTKPLHAAAMRGYDGEMNPEAIGSYVAELGLTTPPPQPQATPPPVPMDQQEALIRIAEAARDSGGMPQGTPDTTNRIREEMQKAALRGDVSALDRLSIELSRTRGFTTKWDNPAWMDEPSLPPGSPAMPVVTQPRTAF